MIDKMLAVIDVIAHFWLLLTIAVLLFFLLPGTNLYEIYPTGMEQCGHARYYHDDGVTVTGGTCWTSLFKITFLGQGQFACNVPATPRRLPGEFDDHDLSIKQTRCYWGGHGGPTDLWGWYPFQGAHGWWTEDGPAVGWEQWTG